MDALTDLLATLLVLSGVFMTLALVCDLIERLPTLALARPRRARARPAQRRGRVARPRRRPDECEDRADLSARLVH